MLTISKERILEKCDAHVREALHEAANLCIAQTGREIGAGHLLHAILSQPANQAARMLAAMKIEREELRAKIARSFERLKRGSSELPSFSPMLLHLLQDAFMIATGELGASEIGTGAVLIAAAADAGRYCDLIFYADFEAMNAQDMRRRFRELSLGAMEGGQAAGVGAAPAGGAAATQGGGSESALEKYGRCVTRQAREGKIDPVFRRDAEIAQMTDILCRRRKNNPILVGEAGVGKTALAEGLALKIIEGDVPPALQDVELWELDMGALQAGASVKGEFERRLKAVLEEATSAGRRIVLFIDEAHTLIGGGGPAGGSDAANLLKPALARGGLRAIAATTWSEYKKYFEKDPALSRRFQLIKLAEPTPDQAIDILRGLRGVYEAAHKVYVTDEALAAAARLSARYVSGRQLPDKAIDALDTACVRVAAASSAKPRALDSLEREIVLKRRAREALARDRKARADDGAEGAVADAALGEEIARMEAEAEDLRELWTTEKGFAERILAARARLMAGAPEAEASQEAAAEDLRAARAELAAYLDGRPGLTAWEVDGAEVAGVISDWTGVPAAMMSEDEAERLLRLGDDLRGQIFGQDAAIEAIHARLKAARADLIRPTAPRGVFLLVGPSGVGKTETALQVAERLYGGKQFLTTINMSEYQEKHSLSRLIGSPPGYVGYGEGGLLTEAIRRAPHAVVLLDEVEKAHPDIMNLFYQAFDKGEVNDGEGREIDCKNIVFFMTSNLGSEALTQNAETVRKASLEALEKALTPHLLTHFKPALLARMQIVCFKPLPEEVFERIIDQKLGALAGRFAAARKAEFVWTPEARKAIAAMCGHVENGARAVEQAIDRKLVPVMAEEALRRIARRAPLERVELDVEDGHFRFAFLPELEEEEAP